MGGIFFDFKRNGDQGQVNFVYKYIKQWYYNTIFCSGDRLAILYAILLGINCIWYNGNHFILYRSNKLKRGVDKNRINKIILLEKLNRLEVVYDVSGVDLRAKVSANIKSFDDSIVLEELPGFTGVADKRVKEFMQGLLKIRMERLYNKYYWFILTLNSYIIINIYQFLVDFVIVPPF